MPNYIFVRWRLLRLPVALIFCASILISYTYLKSRPSYKLYNTLAEQEIQHSRQFIRNNRESKYVLFKQLRGAGFNNQAQEILLFHHLALLTSRVYMYQPIVWRPRGHQSVVPLSAFLAGVTKNSINAAVFNEVCSPLETKHVRLQITHNDRWEVAQRLLNGNEKCIVVDDWLFDWNYLSSSALHSIWPSFQDYLSKHFEWSFPIRTIASRAHASLNLRLNSNQSTIYPGEPYLALHLRRGDFESHCHSLAEDHIGFTTWATLPDLHSSTLPPTLNSTNSKSILEHCYPTLNRILSAIDTHAHARPHLRTVHILHDGAWDHPLVYAQYYKLKAALTSVSRARAAGWVNGPMRRVTHSGAVTVGWGESDWAVAVDVELARQAEVFVGNGFSSLSTQVLALRLGADGGRVQDVTLL